MIDEDLKYWIALKSIVGIGNTLFEALLKHFGSANAIFSAKLHDFEMIHGLNKKSATAIISFKNWDPILRQLDILHQKDIEIVTYEDDIYPSRLLNIYDRPVFLYVMGHLEKDDVPIAIVGSRRASTYGRYTTDRISRELTLRGMTIVSGMARGIDSYAHRGALAARGRTIAVLGCGLDVIYPPENKKLFHEIIESGALISEYFPGTQPLPYHFPARNRIISGMSYGVVVVEAGEKSGSLITARLAMEQGRDVFAVPGMIDSAASRGTHSLIKQGAKLTENIDDILEDILPQLEHSFTQAIPQKQGIAAHIDIPTSPDHDIDTFCLEELTIMRLLSHKETHVDDIISKSSMAPSDVLSVLIKLELKGFILQHPGKLFSLKK